VVLQLGEQIADRVVGRVPGALQSARNLAGGAVGSRGDSIRSEDKLWMLGGGRPWQ
jgi:hypothetical protein